MTFYAVQHESDFDCFLFVGFHIKKSKVANERYFAEGIHQVVVVKVLLSLWNEFSSVTLL